MAKNTLYDRSCARIADLRRRLQEAATKDRTPAVLRAVEAAREEIAYDLKIVSDRERAALMADAEQRVLADAQSEQTKYLVAQLREAEEKHGNTRYNMRLTVTERVKNACGLRPNVTTTDGQTFGFHAVSLPSAVIPLTPAEEQGLRHDAGWDVEDVSLEQPLAEPVGSDPTGIPVASTTDSSAPVKRTVAKGGK